MSQQGPTALSATVSSPTIGLTMTSGGPPGRSGQSSLAGTLLQRPAASAVVIGTLYYATDAAGGTLYRSTGSVWQQVGPSAQQFGGAMLGLVTYMGADWTTSSTTMTDVPGMSLTVTPGTRPLIHSYGALIERAATGPATGVQFALSLMRDTTRVDAINDVLIGGTRRTVQRTWSDQPPAGVATTYKLQMNSGDATTAFTFKAGLTIVAWPFPQYQIVEG